MAGIRVRYENGVFRPLRQVPSLRDGAIGEVRLQEVHKTAKRLSVRSSDFFGLWKDRKDIGNGLSYVKKLRAKTRY